MICKLSKKVATVDLSFENSLKNRIILKRVNVCDMCREGDITYLEDFEIEKPADKDLELRAYGFSIGEWFKIKNTTKTGTLQYHPEGFCLWEKGLEQVKEVCTLDELDLLEKQ